MAVSCDTCGRLPTGTYDDGSPLHDHGHTPDGGTWDLVTDPGRIVVVTPQGVVAIRTCPACHERHPALTTCAGGWSPADPPLPVEDDHPCSAWDGGDAPA